MKYFISLLFVILITQTILPQSTMVIYKNDGTSEAIDFADIKTISFADNLIKNGTFNDALKNWLFVGKGTNYYHPEDPGRADFNIVNGLMEININNQGNTIYSIILYQSCSFEKDVTYIASFDAKADMPVEIISNVTQDYTWTNYTGDVKFNLTTSMNTYSYSFKMPITGFALFQYCLGILGTRKITIDNISIRKL